MNLKDPFKKMKLWTCEIVIDSFFIKKRNSIYDFHQFFSSLNFTTKFEIIFFIGKLDLKFLEIYILKIDI